MLRKRLLHSLFLIGLGVQLACAQATIRFDPSFAEAGLVATALGGNFDGATTYVVLPDGRYALAGGSNLPFVEGSGGFDLAVPAYRQDGRLDEGFGVEGIVRLDLGQANGADEWAYALAADRAGSVVVAGYAKKRGEEDEALQVARLEADGSLDPDFGDGGIVTLDLTPNDDRGVAIFPADEGRLLVGIQNAGVFMAVRLTSVGILDPTYRVGGIASTAWAATRWRSGSCWMPKEDWSPPERAVRFRMSPSFGGRPKVGRTRPLVAEGGASLTPGVEPTGPTSSWRGPTGRFRSWATQGPGPTAPICSFP